MSLSHAQHSRRSKHSSQHLPTAAVPRSSRRSPPYPVAAQHSTAQHSTGNQAAVRCTWPDRPRLPIITSRELHLPPIRGQPLGQMSMAVRGVRGVRTTTYPACTSVRPRPGKHGMAAMGWQKTRLHARAFVSATGASKANGGRGRGLGLGITASLPVAKEGSGPGSWPALLSSPVTLLLPYGEPPCLHHLPYGEPPSPIPSLLLTMRHIRHDWYSHVPVCTQYPVPHRHSLLPCPRATLPSPECAVYFRAKQASRDPSANINPCLNPLATVYSVLRTVRPHPFHSAPNPHPSNLPARPALALIFIPPSPPFLLPSFFFLLSTHYSFIHSIFIHLDSGRPFFSETLHSLST